MLLKHFVAACRRFGLCVSVEKTEVIVQPSLRFVALMTQSRSQLWPFSQSLTFIFMYCGFLLGELAALSCVLNVARGIPQVGNEASEHCLSLIHI